MPISTRTLVQIAAWGGVVVASTGFYLQNKLVQRMQCTGYYKDAMKKLRSHPGAVYYLGEPIKDRKFKLSDAVNNACDESNARFCIPVVGQKDRGKYYFWAEKSVAGWEIVRAELELPSKPDESDVLIVYESISPHHHVINTVMVGHFYSCWTAINLPKMAKFVGTAKEKYYYHNTLLCLVKYLQGRNITIDLRNDAYVCGGISTVDGYMNVSFANAVYCDTRGNEYFFENLFVHARNIRYVHVPETIPIIQAIKDELNTSKRSFTKKPVEKSRKARKALQLHMQTVASLD